MQDRTHLRPTLRDVLFTLFRFRWTSMLTFLLICFAGFLITIRTPRVFEAKTRVFIGADVKQLKLNQSDQTMRVTLEEMISTEVEIARSLPVIEEAIKLSGADHFGQNIAVDQIMSQLSVLPVHNTSLIELSIEHEDPAFATLLLDNIVNTYINERQEKTVKDEELLHYDRLLNDINKRIDSTEAEYNLFNINNNITLVAAQQQTDQDRLIALDNSRVMKEQQLLIQRRTLRILDSLLLNFDPGLIPSVIADKDIQIRNWLNELLSVERERFEAESRLTATAPEVKRLDYRLQVLRNQLRDQFEAVVQASHRELQTTIDELSLLRQEINGINARSRELSRASSRHSNLDQQLDDLRSVRTVLTRQLEETRIHTAEYGGPRVEQLEPAHASPGPVKPNLFFNFIATLGLALIVSISLPYYLQSINNVIFHDFELQRATGLTVMCTVKDAK
jgi:uncharacterized protein involved in exopolysaccharide biosynthesis